MSYQEKKFGPFWGVLTPLPDPHKIHYTIEIEKIFFLHHMVYHRTQNLILISKMFWVVLKLKQKTGKNTYKTIMTVIHIQRHMHRKEPKWLLSAKIYFLRSNDLQMTWFFFQNHKHHFNKTKIWHLVFIQEYL